MPARLLRFVFALALLFTLVMALLPKPPQLPGSPSDKVQHIAAFLVLTGLGAAAFPRAGILRLGAWLSAFGALIEVLQAIPALHRDSDVRDWIADTLAVLAVLAIVTLIQRRRRNAS